MGGIPDGFCCGAIAGEDKAQARGRGVPAGQGQGHRSEEVEALGGGWDRACACALGPEPWGLSLGASLVTKRG